MNILQKSFLIIISWPYNNDEQSPTVRKMSVNSFIHFQRLKYFRSFKTQFGNVRRKQIKKILEIVEQGYLLEWIYHYDCASNVKTPLIVTPSRARSTYVIASRLTKSNERLLYGKNVMKREIFQSTYYWEMEQNLPIIFNTIDFFICQ